MGRKKKTTCNSKTSKCHLECGTVKTSEFMTARVELVVMNSNVFTLPNCSCDCACNLCDILNGTYMFCYLYMYLNNLKHYT